MFAIIVSVSTIRVSKLKVWLERSVSQEPLLVSIGLTYFREEAKKESKSGKSIMYFVST